MGGGRRERSAGGRRWAAAAEAAVLFQALKNLSSTCLGLGVPCPALRSRRPQWFMQVDTDRSGNINSAELQRALAMGGLNFSLAICQQLIRAWD